MFNKLRDTDTNLRALDYYDNSLYLFDWCLLGLKWRLDVTIYSWMRFPFVALDDSTLRRSWSVLRLSKNGLIWKAYQDRGGVEHQTRPIPTRDLRKYLSPVQMLIERETTEAIINE